MSKPRFSFTNSVFLALTIACAPIFVGCSGGTGDGGKVYGVVTVDGDPVEHGAITFKPLDAKSSGTGAVISEGKYEAIVPHGKSKVEIRVPVVVGQEKMYDVPDSPLMDVTRESLPAKYHDRTELELDVVAGDNNKDWKLDGKKKRK